MSFLKNIAKEIALVSLQFETKYIWLSIDLLALTYDLRLSRNEINEFAIELIKELKNSQSEHTYFISTFNFDFPHTGIFNAKLTPCQSGAFGSILLKEYPFRRTRDVFYSFLVFGKNSETIIKKTFYSSTGPGSIFEYLLKNNTITINVGHHWVKSFSSVHHAEHIAKVRYRYQKKFTGEMILSNGERLNVSQPFFVRNQSICLFSSVTLKANEYFLANHIVQKKLINPHFSKKVLVYSTNLALAHEELLRDMLSLDSCMVDFIPIDGKGGSLSSVITADLANRLYIDDLAVGK